MSIAQLSVYRLTLILALSGLLLLGCEATGAGDDVGMAPSADASGDTVADVYEDVPLPDASTGDVAADLDVAPGCSPDGAVLDRPDTSAPEACDPTASWCRVDPWQWYGDATTVFALDSNDVWVVGKSGRIQHWDGSELTLVRENGNEYLDGVWASSSSDVWVVGSFGLALHWDGATWTRTATCVDSFMVDVWGSGPDDVWAVAWPNEVLHWDGHAWSREVLGSDELRLNGVWGSGPDDVWAVGQAWGGCEVWHWNGRRWDGASGRIFSGTASDQSCEAIWGSSSTDIWVAGYGSDYDDGSFKALVAHWDGSEWQRVPSPADAGESLGIAGGEAGDVWLVERDGVHHWEDDAWVERNPPGVVSPLAARVAPDGHVFLAAGKGGFYEFIDGVWRELALPVPDLYAVETDPSATWVFGSHGAALRRDGEDWQREEVGTRLELYAAWLDPDGHPWVVGESGAAFRRTASGWEALGLETDRHLRGVWGRSADDVWIVGGTVSGHDPTLEIDTDGEADTGYVARWDGASWSTLPAPEGVTLLGVTGTAEGEVWVGGFANELYQWDGQAWVPYEIDWGLPRLATGLRDVFVDAGGRVWACGGSATGVSDVPLWSGFVTSGDDTGWTTFQTNRATELEGVWSDGQGLAVAVGQGNEIWLGRDGSWESEVPDAYFLHGVHGQPDGDVYVVGQEGHVLMRSFDAAE